MAEEKYGSFCWIVRYKYIDPYQNDDVVYLNEAEAQKAAGYAAQELAHREMEAFEEAEGDTNLIDVLQFYDQKNYLEAYRSWSSYADEHDSEDTVELDQVNLVR